MGIRVLESPAPPAETERLVAGDPRAGLFHHPRWIAALGRAYPRLRPRYLVLEEEGRVTAVTPMAVVRRFGLREVVSMPFGTHGGPVSAPEATSEGIHRLNTRFVRLLRGPAVYRYEMTVLDPPEPLAKSLDALLGPRLVTTTTHVLDLTPGAEALWKGYQQQLRRSVRMAAKAGVAVREARGPAALAAFHPLYVRQSEHWSLTWHHARDALHRLAEGLGDDLRVWVASRKGTDVCAQLGLYHEGKDVYLWMSGAAPESRSVFAFHFLLHSMVRDAAVRGFTTCHFGASMDMPGIETFKGAFGAEARPLHRYYHQARWREWVQRARWGRGRSS